MNESVTTRPRKKSRLFNILKKTRQSISSIFSSKSRISEEEIEDLHDTLIISDIGWEVSDSLISAVKAKMKRSEISSEDLRQTLVDELSKILKAAEWDFNLDEYTKPIVILMVGVNGVGKTTTSAKIAQLLKQQGHEVMFAACDTFRPAAIEQLQTWGTRLNVPVISQKLGADPAAVAHDAYHSAVARQCSVLVIDTSGRQQTRDDLMRQLGKIRRVLQKLNPATPQITLITIDACTGQNAISQVDMFNQHTPLNGICISKLDGTAKAGIIVAITQKFNLSIPFIGIGEKIDDITPFHAEDYANSLFKSETR